MRKSLLAVVAFLLVLPLGAAPSAIRYEFQQVTKSDSSNERPRVLIGSAFLDRGMSRVDYASESTAGAGTWVISRNGGRDTYYVDPATKTYFARSSGELSDALDGLQFKVSNLKIESKYLGSGPVIAGHPTEHHRLKATYDVSIALGPIPLVQHVQTVIDKWTTLAFGDVGATYFSGNLPQSGDPEIDKIIEAETLQISGFPLRQVTTVTTKLSNSNLPKSSQIQVERSRRQSTELLITKIGRAESDMSLFQLPAGYKSLDEASLSGGLNHFQTVTPQPDYR